MKDPKGGYASQKTIVLWGCGVVAAIGGLILLFVPSEPQNKGVAETLAQKQPMFETPVSLSPQDNYTKYCAACHGDKGDANTQMARMMSIKPPNLVHGPFRFERTKEATRNLIRFGSQVMPGFEREISHSDADALAQFVLDMEAKPQ